MYNKQNHDEDCFIIIKRPCGQRRQEFCSFPPEIRFENDEKGWDDNWQDSNFDNNWNDNRFDRKQNHGNCCNCNCHKEEERRPRKRCCCFNFFRCC